MAGEAAKLWVSVGGDVSQAQGVLVKFDGQMKQVAGSVDKSAKSASASLRKIDNVARGLSGGLSGLAAAAGIGGLLTIGAAAASTAVELGNMGQAIEQQRNLLEVWSGSSENAARNMDAMRAAVGKYMTESQMLSGANQLLNMGLAKTSEELARNAEAAVLLGDKTASVSERMQSWNAMLANQSIERLDMFGISSGNARQQIDELMKSTDGLTREQAFQAVVLEEAEKKVRRLKDAGFEATTAADNMAIAWAKLGETIAIRFAAPIAEAERNIAEIINSTALMVESHSADTEVRLAAMQTQVEAARTELAALGDVPFDVNAEFDTGAGKAEMLRQRIEHLENAIRALTPASNDWSDAGVRGADLVAQKLREVQNAAYAARSAMGRVAVEETAPVVADPSKTQWGLYTDWARKQANAINSQSDIDQLIEDWKERVGRTNDDIAKDAAKAYEKEMQVAASRVQGFISTAMSNAKGLFDVSGSDPFAPGKNGPFENVYRALDVAKNGEASPWAKVLGMDQETAQRLSEQFQKGLFTPEVIDKLINVDALVAEAQLQDQAQKLMEAFANSIATQAGVDASVAKSLLSFGEDTTAFDETASTVVKGVADSMVDKTKEAEQIGKNLIDGVSKGATSAKTTAVKTVTDIADAMVKAMQDTLKIASPSQVFAALGYNAIAGMVVGWERGTADVEAMISKSTGDLLNAATQAVQMAVTKPTIPDVIFSGMTAASVAQPKQSVRIDGDTYNMLIADQGTAELTTALIDSNRKARLNQFMGMQ